MTVCGNYNHHGTRWLLLIDPIDRRIVVSMNLDTLNTNHRNEIEQLITKLLATMRKAKVTDDPIYHSLQKFEQELGEARRRIFDSDQSEYFGY
jgi:hypothetical protein